MLIQIPMGAYLKFKKVNFVQLFVMLAMLRSDKNSVSYLLHLH